ncbi:hypothetical protein LJB76_01475 [Clostridia bacterium OttesenSCG-928-O13]|nr:hypothetical protein [Clostridia bacterium OttesenSCG-928-O13]
MKPVQKHTAALITKKAIVLLLALVLVFSFGFPASAANAHVGIPTFSLNSTVIGFAGFEWWVVGTNCANNSAQGIYATTPNSITLLLKEDLNNFFGQGMFRFGSDSYFPDSTPFSSAQVILHYSNNTFPPNWKKPNEYAQSALQIILWQKAYSIPLNELAVINPRTLTKDDDTIIAPMAGPDVPNQLLWPLSYDEHEALPSEVTAFSGRMYWLRSAGDYGIGAVFVDNGTSFVSYTSPESYSHVRPALNLNMSNVQMVSSANGKPTTIGLSQVSAPSGTLKLTLTDSNLTLNNETLISVAGRTITFSYQPSAASGSTFNTLSAAILGPASSPGLKYYGHIDNSPPQSGTGTVSVTVPENLASGDTLHVFLEDVRGALNTDFSSPFVQLTFAEQSAPTGLSGAACTTPDNNDGKITGTTTAMEYSADGTNWSSCTAGATTVSAPGTYQVRLAGTVSGTTALLVGPAASGITVAAYSPAPAPTPTPTPTPTSTAGAAAGATTGGSPQTGDNANFSTALVAALACFAAMLGTLFFALRHRGRS